MFFASSEPAHSCRAATSVSLEVSRATYPSRVDALALSHSLQAVSLISLYLPFRVSKDISVFGGGRAILALGPVPQLQDGAG